MVWKMRSLITGIMIAAACQAAAGVEPAENAAARTIEVDLDRVQKDLSRSYLGADAEDFATGFDFNWLLTDGWSDFAAFVQQTGTRVLRLADMSRYSFRGERETRLVRARKYAKTDDAKYANLIKKPLDWWFRPEDFYAFCRENNIRVIPMVNAQSYYDAEADTAHYFIDRPEHYAAAADEAAHYVRWVKENGFLDLVVGWEIGNECYMYWEPQEYAAYARQVIHAVRAIDPEIKLGVPVFICQPDDPDVLARNGQAQLDEWLAWTRAMFAALGDDAQHLSYGVTHFYGAGRAWNSNYRGIADHDELLKSITNAQHLEMINTEWRHTSGDDQAGHRRYDIAGLWNTKFGLTMMAYPNMHYTGLHSFLWFGGLGAWSNGDVWWQRPEPKSKSGFIDDPQKRRRLTVGPFAEPSRMANTLIDDHPLLVAHGADLGDLSSALYYEKREGDLQWFVATDEARGSVAAILVNTTDRPQAVTFAFAGGAAATGREAVVEAYWCDPDKREWLAPPEALDHLHTRVTQQPAGDAIVVPAHGIAKAVVPLERRE